MADETDAAEPRRERPPNRSSARLAAVQALYQLDMTDGRVEKVVAEFNRHRLGKEIEGATYLPADRELFAALVRTATERREAIDALISERLAPGWTFSRMNATLRALLRAAVAELLTRTDIPPAVTINEFVDVAHGFFAGDEPGFVNRLLDRTAHAVRAGDMAAHGRGGG